MAFVPTPFTSSVVAPDTYQAFREAPYLSPSMYRFAPTSVGTAALVAGSSDPEGDSVVSLAQVIQRASSWIDDHVYHGGDGSLVGSITVEQMMVTPKPDGSLVVIANMKPVREVLGLALGPSPSGLTNLDSNTAQDIIIGEKTITVPPGFNFGNSSGYYGSATSGSGQVLVVYSYIAGYPHSTLGQNAAAGATSIVVNPPVPGASQLYSAYSGSSLTIYDGGRTEVVRLAAVPSGLTLQLASPLVYNHTLPAVPDSIMVSALPGAVVQACISMTNVLIKTQGFRAQVLPGSVGSNDPLQRQAMERAGAFGDFKLATTLLEPYVTTYFH